MMANIYGTERYPDYELMHEAEEMERRREVEDSHDRGFTWEAMYEIPISLYDRWRKAKAEYDEVQDLLDDIVTLEQSKR